MEQVPESLSPELAPPPVPPPDRARQAGEGDAPAPLPPDVAQSVRSIHAMQAGMLPFFVLYAIMSVLIAAITANGLLVGISLCGLLVPLVGKVVEKRNSARVHAVRLVAIAALCIEAGLFFGWQSAVFFLFH